MSGGKRGQRLPAARGCRMLADMQSRVDVLADLYALILSWSHADETEQAADVPALAAGDCRPDSSEGAAEAEQLLRAATPSKAN